MPASGGSSKRIKNQQTVNWAAAFGLEDVKLSPARETFEDTEMIVDEPEQKLDVAMESPAALQIKQEEDF